MSFSKSFLLLGIFYLSSGAFALWAQTSNGPASPVVAEVGGNRITQHDFEQKQAAKLLPAKYKYYLAEKQALDDVIDDQLLAQQAQRENVTVAQLLDRHVNATIPQPTEDQLKVFYEGMQTDQPYEEVRGQIVEALHRIRFDKAKAAYLKGLREANPVMVALQPPTAGMNVEVGDAPVRGDRKAPVMLVEYADYQCPYCEKIDPDLRRIEKEYAGKVAFAFKDFPLPAHNRAPKAAEASRCAGEQGKYWEYHDVLFTSKELDPERLKRYAHNLNLDEAQFSSCLESGKQAPAIRKDMAEGEALGLTQTPSFFINGHYFAGAIPYSTLRDIVEQQLAAAEKQPEKSTRAAIR